MTAPDDGGGPTPRFIALFLAIPIVNLLTPLVAMAFMVHVYKRVGRNAAPGGASPSATTMS
jgi:hypothetical protein